jgi:hypothetical protein
VAEAELNEVAKAEVPSEDGKVMDKERSLAIVAGKCRRVEERPSVVEGGAPEAVPVVKLPNAQASGAGVV